MRCLRLCPCHGGAYLKVGWGCSGGKKRQKGGCVGKKCVVLRSVTIAVVAWEVVVSGSVGQVCFVLLAESWDPVTCIPDPFDSAWPLSIRCLRLCPCRGGAYLMVGWECSGGECPPAIQARRGHDSLCLQCIIAYCFNLSMRSSSFHPPKPLRYMVTCTGSCFVMTNVFHLLRP